MKVGWGDLRGWVGGWVCGGSGPGWGVTISDSKSTRRFPEFRLELPARSYQTVFLNNDKNTGNLWSAYPVAQSAEQYRLNTYMYIEIMNIIKKEKNSYINTAGRRCTGIDNSLSVSLSLSLSLSLSVSLSLCFCLSLSLYIFIHTHTRARAHTPVSYTHLTLPTMERV